jgi:hypothetical protein
LEEKRSGEAEAAAILGALLNPESVSVNLELESASVPVSMWKTRRLG